MSCFLVSLMSSKCLDRKLLILSCGPTDGCNFLFPDRKETTCPLLRRFANIFFVFLFLNIKIDESLEILFCFRFCSQNIKPRLNLFSETVIIFQIFYCSIVCPTVPFHLFGFFFCFVCGFLW